MRNKKFYALLALLLAAGGVTMQAQTEDDFWIEVNTNGEWFHHPVGPSIDTVYAASMHGVYRSTDSCRTWQCVGFENQSVYFLYLSEDHELYASVAPIPPYTSPLYKWDGNSWNMLHHSTFSAPWAFIKASDGTLYVGDNRGICISVDGGDTWWISWDNPHEGVTVVNGFVELDDGTMFASLTGASDYHTGVIRSIDHGLSWESVGLDENYLISFAKSPDGTVYAGCDGYNNDEDVGVFRTEDNGETWEMLNGDFRVNSIVVDDNDNVYIAHIDFQGLYRSNDGGYNFENISSGMDYIQTGLSILPDGYMLSYEYNGSIFFGKMFVSRKTVYMPFELEVVTEPSDGGVANGSGTYLFGERAHLTATANENYLFVGWTNQDGDTISTDSDYAHMVARGGQITAHFVNDDGIEETRKHNMTVFPNPGNNSITISTALPNARVEIYDFTGKLVYNQEITDNVTSINTENWPSGMYFWKVVFGTSTGSVTEAECGKWIKK